MRIAVFGAGSLVGQELTVLALRHGHTVFAVVRGSEASLLRAWTERGVDLLQPLPAPADQRCGRDQRRPYSAPVLTPPAASNVTTPTAPLAQRLIIVTSDMPWSDEALQAVHEADIVVSTFVPKFATERGHGMGLDRIIGAMHDVRRSNRSRGMRQRLIALVGEGVLQATKNKLMMQLPGFSPKFHQAAVEHLAAWIALARSSLDWTLVCTPPIVAKVASAHFSAPASPNSSTLDLHTLAALDPEPTQIMRSINSADSREFAAGAGSSNASAGTASTPELRSSSNVSVCTQDSACDCDLRSNMPSAHAHDDDGGSMHTLSRTLSSSSTPSASMLSIDSIALTHAAPGSGRSKSFSEAGTGAGMRLQSAPYTVAVDVLPNWSPHEAGMTICRVADVADFTLEAITTYPPLYSHMRVGVASNVRPGS
eukprot:Unigene1835_Nuclearia_a/m.5725 Unigene1835_Nuclearia_a/g.5725  ORF Unigene1835_Nuclearia_a/g.5725 Unigene1835_Nuclearia_a/m.5725 type:complete len:425 (-) Unigene1835_Nuclearia_a:144-1418(-)